MLPLKNILQYERLACQPHKECKTEMVQHQSIMFCDLRIILQVNKDSDNTPGM